MADFLSGNVLGSTIWRPAIVGGVYTLAAGDLSGRVIEIDSASPVDVVVPPDVEFGEFPIPSLVDVVQSGAGQVTVVAGAGVTVRTVATLLLSGQWAAATLYKRATNEWVLVGNLEA